MKQVVALTAATLLCGELHSAGPSASAKPYTDPQLLDVPWGYISFVRQPWRAYLETIPARDYLNGLGIVWDRSVPGRSEDSIAESLAWAGFHRVRLEVPWGAVRWEEGAFDEATTIRLRRVLPALRKYGLRPLILLNANHGQPCPARSFSVQVGRNAPAGSRAIALTAPIAPSWGSFTATIATLADAAHAGPLIQRHAVDRGEDKIQLSKPLSRDVRVGEILQIQVLRYRPLYPAGTPEYEDTLRGWLRYVDLVTRTVGGLLGGDDYDVEIWNELTFGSAFLDVNNYFEPTLTFPSPERDFLSPGGRAWELGNRTVQWLKSAHPRLTVIWGFSNTTFFHVPVAQLPAHTDGQSYHPYGTDRRCYVDLVKHREALLLDKYIPPGCSIQPEGFAHTWQQTESLMRLIAPAARTAHPVGSHSFFHFITEHGFSPASIGITDPTQAQDAKRKFLLRGPMLWLNKGVSALYVNDLYESDDAGMGVFAANGTVGTAMRALHELTMRFAGADPLVHPRQLWIEVEHDGADPAAVSGDTDGRGLKQSETVAFLPFQVSASRFVIGAYIMTQNFPSPLAPQRYHLTIHGLNSATTTMKFYASESAAVHRLEVARSTAASLTVVVSLTDVPGLIEIEESERT